MPAVRNFTRLVFRGNYFDERRKREEAIELPLARKVLRGDHRKSFFCSANIFLALLQLMEIMECKEKSPSLSSEKSFVSSISSKKLEGLEK